MGLINDNFLLSNLTANHLYHHYAKEMPIIDYHCHLSPKEIYEDKRYKNMTELWLGGDHYKWRAMRLNGIEERYITGDASDEEKFFAWAKTMPKLIGNPLYHWTQMELKMYFDIDDLLNEKTAQSIYDRCNTILQSPEFSARALILKSKVIFIGTTDDPVDDLFYHQKLKEDTNFPPIVAPSFRPDAALSIEKDDYSSYIKRLSERVGYPIQDLSSLIQALSDRIDAFDSLGCRSADHGLYAMPFKEANADEVNFFFLKRLQGEMLTQDEIEKFKTYVLSELGMLYSEKEWVMQLHLGPMRNNSTRMFQSIGPDTGFDSMNDEPMALPLSRYLDRLDREGKLPRVVLYNLNPNFNYVLATMIGNFPSNGIPGKLQFGAPWWFNDHRDGMIAQMKTLANVGLLSRFIGMLTDSRSFLSYARHDYFRRVLCSLIGQWVEQGEAPRDEELLKTMIQDISYYNAKKFFKL